MGYIFVNVDEKTITDIYQPSENEYSSYCILDKSGKIVSSSNKDLIFSEVPNDLLEQYRSQSPTQFEYKIDGNGYVISVTPLKYNGLYLVNVTDTAALNHASESIIFNVIIVFLSTLVILIFLTAVFSQKIVSPLKKLTKKMRAEDIIKSETIEMDAISSPDEIEELTIHFNQMISKINQTFDNLKQSEKQKRKTQFALMQEQIKPHFLYNSLDAIYILNHVGKHEEANKATKALADFYRSCLADGNDIVTLKQELDTITNYMLIQQYRHVDTFTFLIEIDEHYYDYLIPKLSLQPIIENALYHGLRTQKKLGNIKIYCYEESQYFYIVVRDDGKGMDQKDADFLLEHADSGFGLYSISSRLKLYFDADCGLQIHSQSGEGTEVQLKILKRKGEINHDSSN